MADAEGLAFGALAGAQRHRGARCNPGGVGRGYVEDDVERGQVGDLYHGLIDVDRRTEGRVQSRDDAGDRRAEDGELRCSAGSRRCRLGLRELGCGLVGVLARNDTSIGQAPRPLVIALGRGQRSFGALTRRNERRLLERDERSTGAHLLSLRDRYDGDARWSRRAERGDVPRARAHRSDGADDFGEWRDRNGGRLYLDERARLRLAVRTPAARSNYHQAEKKKASHGVVGGRS